MLFKLPVGPNYLYILGWPLRLDAATLEQVVWQWERIPQK